MSMLRLTLQILLPIGVLGGGAGAAYLIVSNTKDPVIMAPANPWPLVRTTAALPATERLTVAASGTVEPLRTVELAAEVSGRVIATNASLRAGGVFAAAPHRYSSTASLLTSSPTSAADPSPDASTSCTAREARAAMAVGVQTFGVASPERPWPHWPWLARPKEYTMPSAHSTSEWARPAATCVEDPTRLMTCQYKRELRG